MKIKNIVYNPDQYAIIKSNEIVYCLLKEQIRKFRQPIDEIRNIKRYDHFELYNTLLNIETLIKIFVSRIDNEGNYENGILLNGSGNHFSDFIVENMTYLETIEEKLNEIRKVFDDNFHLLSYLGYDRNKFKADYSVNLDKIVMNNNSSNCIELT